MNELSLADVAALRGNDDGNDGWGNGSGWWIILLFILLGGWGNRGWGNQGGGGYAGGDMLYPWLNQAQLTTQGFADQNAVMALNGIQSSLTAGFANAATQLCNLGGDIQMALCNGFAGVNAGMAAGFAGIEASANARQMANMQQAFGTQTAMMQGFNAIQAQQAQCCCDNQLAMANQTATILAEHCSDRAALSDGVRDIIANQTLLNQRTIDTQNSWGQRIMDQLCQYRMEDKDNEIAQLRTQIQVQNLAASQNAQTAAIIANNEAQTAALERYLAPNPIPAYMVQNPNCCGQTYGCGCAAA